MSYLRKIRYNCKQATFLIEKRSIARLSFREIIELRIHLAGCHFCRLFSKHSHLINELVQELFRNASQHPNPAGEGFKKELQHRIEEGLNKK